MFKPGPIKNFTFFLFILLVGIYACKPKDEIISSDSSIRLGFSNDTVFFDTVFTSSGSTHIRNVTQRLRIFNPSKNAIDIADIRLGGGLSSNYTMFIYGEAKSSIQDVELLGGDSLYVLVQLSINTKQADLPYLVQDSILFSLNGNLQKVRLIAWGQDANYFKQDSITTNTTWTAGKPYVIFDRLKVAKDVTLTIQPGADIVFGNGARMDVAGILNAVGTFEKPINFGGYRQEIDFVDAAGQWDGISLVQNTGTHVLSWCKIKNGISGVSLTGTGVTSQDALKIDHCKIYNMGDACLNFTKTAVTVSNSLFYNAANYLLTASGGGTYKVYNCTSSNSNSDFISNVPSVSMVSAAGDIVWDVTFVNNIIWGSQSNELLLTLPAATPPVVKNNLIRMNATTYTGNGNLLSNTSNYVNFSSVPADPDYYLSGTSPAVNAGIAIPGVTDVADLNNNPRDSEPDMGAMEVKK